MQTRIAYNIDCRYLIKNLIKNSNFFLHQLFHLLFLLVNQWKCPTNISTLCNASTKTFLQIIPSYAISQNDLVISSTTADEPYTDPVDLAVVSKRQRNIFNKTVSSYFTRKWVSTIDLPLADLPFNSDPLWRERAMLHSRFMLHVYSSRAPFASLLSQAFG